MKLGFNLLLWTPHVTEAHEPILRALKKTGYDGVEIPIFDGTPDHYARLGDLLDKIGLERSVVSASSSLQLSAASQLVPATDGGAVLTGGSHTTGPIGALVAAGIPLILALSAVMATIGV